MEQPIQHKIMLKRINSQKLLWFLTRKSRKLWYSCPVASRCVVLPRTSQEKQKGAKRTNTCISYVVRMSWVFFLLLTTCKLPRVISQLNLCKILHNHWAVIFLLPVWVTDIVGFSIEKIIILPPLYLLNNISSFSNDLKS